MWEQCGIYRIHNSKSIIIYKIEKKYAFNKSKRDNGKEKRGIDGERKINERIIFLSSIEGEEPFHRLYLQALFTHIKLE